MFAPAKIHGPILLAGLLTAQAANGHKLNFFCPLLEKSLERMQDSAETERLEIEQAEDGLQSGGEHKPTMAAYRIAAQRGHAQLARIEQFISQLEARRPACSGQVEPTLEVMRKDPQLMQPLLSGQLCRYQSAVQHASARNQLILRSVQRGGAATELEDVPRLQRGIAESQQALRKLGTPPLSCKDALVHQITVCMPNPGKMVDWDQCAEASGLGLEPIVQFLARLYQSSQQPDPDQ